MGTGQNFVLSKHDSLYGSLLQAKRNTEPKPSLADGTKVHIPQQLEIALGFGIKR